MAKTPVRLPGANFRATEQRAADRKTKGGNPFAHTYQRQQFDFTDVNPATVVDGISHALARGTALTLSLTSDGGAVKVTAWVNNQKFAAYAGDAETLNELFEGLGPAGEDGGQETAD